MRYIDVHCHLDGGFYGDIGALISKLNAVGVQEVIAVGCNLDTSVFAREQSEKFPSVGFTVGIHPTELQDFDKNALVRLAELAAHPRCVAIGEIGLDYHYPETDKAAQRAAFTAQLELAHELGLPVQIHSRDCAEDMLCLLKEKRELLKEGFLLHCYSHSTEMSEEFLKLGAYFSFGGTSTWSGSKKARRTIAALPSDRLLTETDSPYLAPKSRYGAFPNTPESIPEILENMAAVRGVSAEEMSETVYKNALALFGKL